MKCSRLILFMLVFALFAAPFASAEEAGLSFSYLAPDTVEVCELQAFDAAKAPAGLEEMYGLFSDADPDCEVYMFRMPEGRALASLSCMLLEEEITAAQLLGYGEELRQGLALALNVKPELIEPFELVEFVGCDALTTSTLLRPGDKVTLEMNVRLFVAEGNLMELWTVAPVQLSYVFDQTAATQLSADLEMMDEVLNSFTFGDEDEVAAEGAITLPHVVISDHSGTFSIAAPLDTVVINPGTAEDAVARARLRAAEVEGGGEWFDAVYRNTMENNCWMLFSREFGMMAQVSVTSNEGFRGFTTEHLLMMKDDILAQLDELFDTVVMSEEPATIEIDGIPHLMLTIDAENAGLPLLTYVIAAADGEGQLYELDLYVDTLNCKDAEAVSEVLLMLMDTLDYFPAAGE